MDLNILKPRKALNKAFLKVKAQRTEIELFKTNLIGLLDKINETETEEFHKNLVSDFLKDTYYKDTHFINTKGRSDLVIHNTASASATVGVIIETKKPTNKAEMLKPDNINTKAFQELVLYYLRERISGKNLEIKYLVATNIYEWYIFDAGLFDKEFANNKDFVKKFTDFEEGRLSGTKTDFFYKDIAQPAIEAIKHEITFTRFDIRDYDKPLRNNDNGDDNTLIALYKLLSPQHLLKLPFANDSNSLDKTFYTELLHIIGLTETKDGSKKLIQRKKEGERNAGSLIESAIFQLDSLDKISRLEKPSQFGETYTERLFSVALELAITWINRILFLKLLEAQLLKYHKGDKSFSFLNLDKVQNFDDLNNLFFSVLARKPQERNDEVKSLFANVPYLNSSLFEPTEIEHSCLFISQLKDGKLPLISSTVIKNNLGEKRTGELITIEYLFEFLNAYDFASEGSEEIQEDNKRLINASVLGLIFEKINGYKDGSFFTPGFITMYMCRETIRHAVVQKFNDAGKNLPSFQNMADLNEISEAIGRKVISRKQANEVVNSLKICDPAVGSGHFLVSALNEIIAIKSQLQILEDKNGKSLNRYEVHVENDELIVTDEDGELFEYNPKLKESQRIQETLFHEKQTIIENCLFGVDLNPNSVKICRLRLWIELLKNAYYKAPDNSELETLPNIDINIKCGNSLISRYGLDADIKQIAKSSKWNIFSYQNAVEAYRKSSDKKVKHELEKLIQNIKTNYVQTIQQRNPKLQKYYKLKQEYDYRFPENGLFAHEPEVDYGGNLEKREQEKQRLAAEIAKILAEIEAEKTFFETHNAFEWRFEFPEVLNEDGDFVGFDVVIGNPPYGIDFSEREKEFLKAEYDFLVERIRNSFLYFLGLGLTITRKNGILNYIIPNEILFQIYMTKARKYFLTEKRVLSVVNLGDNIFEDAVVSCAILEIQNRTEDKYSVLMADIREKIKEKQVNPDVLVKVSSDFLKANFNQIYVVGSEKSNLVNKLMNDFSTLESISKSVSNGISTSCDNVYIANGETINNYKIEKSVAKRTIRGSNFNKFWIDKNIDDYVLYVTKDTLMEKIPNTIAYLEPNKELLIKSSVEKKQGKRNWHILFRNREECDFVAPKILVRQTADRIIAALDNEIGFYPIDTVNVVKLQSDEMDLNLAVLGILNSKLITFFYQEISQEGGRILAQVKPSRVKAVPIPNLKNTKSFSKLVSQVIAKKQKNKDTTDLESQIDQIVYQLYGLTEEEIKLVEGK